MVVVVGMKKTEAPMMEGNNPHRRTRVAAAVAPT